MKRLLSSIAVSLSLVSLAIAQPNQVNIIPKPNSVQSRSGSFVIDNNVALVALRPRDRQFALLLQREIKSALDIDLKVTSKALKGRRNIVVGLIEPGSSEIRIDDNYWIEVANNLVNLNSASSAGLFYAIQSFKQLLPSAANGSASIPALKINDGSRFRYRGMHLDVARHFQPIEFVKKFIDQMARYKFNHFHWHLTDDQGWRIEIKKYPKLTEIGSKRPESVKERNITPYVGDGIPHGGFYTQEQIKDVVAYAKARHITVVPEIELPGHASAALAAYPQFGCKADYQYKIQTSWGIFKEVFCPTDETFKFLEDVLDETMQLFPDSPYVHIGGDEVLKDHWKESAFVQELKKKHNLKDEHEVQSYFVQRMERYVNSKGKKIIGWDEILEGGIAPNATIMSWRGEKGGIEAAKAKHDVIMTPNTYVYFDYGQGDPAYEPLNIGSYVPPEKVYSWNPVPKELSPDEAKYILGGQANIWSEYLKTPERVEYMAFPRMLALSEVLWSRQEDRNFQDFQSRLMNHLPRLEKAGINYRIPEPMPVGAFLLNETEAYAFEVSSPVPGGKVHYTKDGSTPTENSPIAESRISVFPIDDEPVTIKAIVVLPSGRKSNIYAATFLRGKMREPETLAESKPGVNYEIVVPAGEGGADETKLKGETRGILLSQFEKQIDLKKNFGVAYDGYLKVPADGVYEFQIESTWDATVVLGVNQVIIDDTGTAESKKRNALVPLKAGLHKISLRYNHRGGPANFRFRWGIKGQGLNQAYGGEFVH
jgi:hexosaminidase